MTKHNDKKRAHAGVRFPPPLLFILGFGVSLLVHKLLPYYLIPDSLAGVFSIIGRLCTLIGFAFMIWGLLTFRRFRTAIIPNQPASQVVTSGPYRFSRNPMYVGFTAAYIGGSLLINTLWALLLLPVILWLLVVLVIRPEERYLTKAFGSVYTDYANRVRRWL